LRALSPPENCNHLPALTRANLLIPVANSFDEPSRRRLDTSAGFPIRVDGYTSFRTKKVLVRKGNVVVVLLLLLLVLILAGAGFAVHLLWIAAVIFAVFWIIGVGLGRGESAGNHRFYRW
jgi:hypothetical protein